MPGTPEKDTVSMHFVRAAVAALSATARATVLRAAAIPPELLALPQARVTAEAFGTLWLAVAREIDDEFFALDSRRMKVGSFGLLCRGALHGADLGRALQRLAHGFGLVFDDVSVSVRVEQRLAILEISNRIAAGPARRFADETLLVLLHGTMCWLAGKRITLGWVAFAHPRPAHADEYRTMFSQQLRFEAPRTAIAFDARLLKARVVQNEATLKTFLRAAPQSVFLKYKNASSWTARVRLRLRHALGQAGWPTFHDVAREHRLAASTLRRRLEAEGTSYQAIKDDLRRDVAIHLLSGSASSVSVIAAELGFQEASAFRRAFKQWTGVQPMNYRATKREGDSGQAAAPRPG